MDDLQLPHINYAALAPMLILFGAACLGVLVEALVPRDRRYPVQLGLGLAGLVAAGIMVIAQANTRILTAGGAIAVDGPTLFLQGALIALGVVALLFIAERSLETGGPFVAQAAVVVGSQSDRVQATRRPGSTEVYPLMLFTLGGMQLFVAANDLLTMFVAL